MSDRGVSSVLGMVLVAGIIVLLLATVQTNAVPGWNKAVEFTHHEHVRDDFKHLHDAVGMTAADGSERTVTLALAPSYPQRYLLRNPPDPTGTIETEAAAGITLANVTAEGDAGDYWDGARKTYSTRAFVYRPTYNYLRSVERTVYENGIVFSQFDTANITATDQSLVDGRRITLVSLNGSLSRSSGESASVKLEPVSAPGHVIAVSNASGPVTITIPTLLDNETWTAALEDEKTSRGGYIETQSFQPGDPYNRLTLEFEPGVTYELRLARVGVGTDVDAVEEPSYVTRADGDNQSVFVGDTVTLTAGVRDRFNAPRSGEQVTFTVLNGRGEFANGANTVTATTDAAGEATARFTPKNDADTVIQASIGGGARERERVNFSVQVNIPPSRGGQSAGIVLQRAELYGGSDNNRVDMMFENLEDPDRNVSDVAISFYYDEQRGSGIPEVNTTTIDGRSTVEIGGDFLDISDDPLVIYGPGGNTTTVTARFTNVDGGKFDVDEGDFYTITLIYEDGSAATYFVVPNAD